MNKSLVSKIRKRKSLTQEALAEKAYVTVRTIQRIEAGEEVSSETLRSVSNALGVNVSDLFESVEKEVELMKYSTDKRNDQRESIQNIWQLIAKRWWIIFPIGGFLSWLIPYLMGS